MNENEMTVIEMIRNNSNPERAMVVVIEIISRFLKQPESFE